MLFAVIIKMLIADSNINSCKLLILKVIVPNGVIKRDFIEYEEN